MFFHRLFIEKIKNRQGQIDSAIGSPNLRPRRCPVAVATLRIVTIYYFAAFSWIFEQNSFMRSLTMNCRSIPIMDVRIRTPDRRIANLMIKVSLTDQQLSSCEISSKPDLPFSQNRCVTSGHTDTHTDTHTHRPAMLKQKKHSYTMGAKIGYTRKKMKKFQHQ